MERREIAALLAYIDRLDPTRAPQDRDAAAERLDQWSILLAHVPATAQHPDGPEHGWDAAVVAARYIATSPYPIKPSDIGRPWETFRADILTRHVGTFEPTAHPEINPDDETGNAYVAALRAERQAVATGRALPNTHRAITAGPPAKEVERRLAELGSYLPRHVEGLLAEHRPTQAARVRAIQAGQPDALAVTCPWCRAEPRRACTVRGRRLSDGPHNARIEAARAAERAARQESAA
ncbi:zinc finger domain-containing protein [Streptomyces sp. enrichment culture]|uniref:zinc finger domain-containing protein n=1 Tax=Streptomyces sp. enrichment culture TaxID=1795815 RepID=UPI003F5451AB